MVVESRKTLVWGTAAGAVVSAALLASGGGGPRVAGLVGDTAQSRPVASVQADAAAPGLAGSAGAAPAAPAH